MPLPLLPGMLTSNLLPDGSKLSSKYLVCVFSVVLPVGTTRRALAGNVHRDTGLTGATVTASGRTESAALQKQVRQLKLLNKESIWVPIRM